MNYQPIKLLGGAIVQVDLDSRERKCNSCKQMIKFGITKNGKYMPIIQVGNEYQSHFADCKFANKFRKTDLEKNINKENTNQEFINDL